MHQEIPSIFLFDHRNEAVGTKALEYDAGPKTRTSCFRLEDIGVFSLLSSVSGEILNPSGLITKKITVIIC